MAYWRYLDNLESVKIMQTFLSSKNALIGIGVVICLLIAHSVFNKLFSTQAKLDNYLTAWAHKGKFSGSVLVAYKGKILLSKGYGMANYEHQVPNTPQTKFHIGSITKQFTSMAIMQLVQQGKLKLTDTIANIFPDYPRGKDITVYQLLTHTAGIVGNADHDRSKPATIAKLVATFKDKPLEFVPGSKHEYSNAGYILLAAIIEKVSGQTYEEFLRDHIFKPVGMPNSGLLHNKPLLPHRAQGYVLTDGSVQNSAYYDPSGIIGAGALYSTIEDLYRWDRALYGDSLISHELSAQLFKPYLDNYALGWVVSSVYDHRYVWHNGGYRDCTAMFTRFIDDDLCIIVLTNFEIFSIGRRAVESIATDLAAIVLGKPYQLSQETSVIKSVIKLDPALYDSYVGQYELSKNFTITIIKDGEHLFIQLTGQQAFELFAESETEFFLKIVDAQVTFVKDAHGVITQLILHQNGKDMPAKKIK